MIKAIWRDTVLAESDDTVEVDGNHYFPVRSVKKDYLQENNYHTLCLKKGTANFYDLVIGEEIEKNIAWYYPEPEPSVMIITGRVAFDTNKRIRLEE